MQQIVLPKVLVTGATGYVGAALIKRLSDEYPKGNIFAAIRRQNVEFPESVKLVLVRDLLPATDWGMALRHVQVVVHCAAHMIGDSLETYRKVNVWGTLNLAKQAFRAGAKRFVFISSIKVNGESTLPNRPFRADDPAAPKDFYSISKTEAEIELRQLSQDTGMEVVIIRPPLVYGPEAQGNFAMLLNWVRLGLPLPLGFVTKNRRSLVALDNLIDLILTCMIHPNAANQTFLVSDMQDFSTTALLQSIKKAMNSSTLLFPVPASLLVCAAHLIGKKDEARSLFGSLQVDMTKTCELLDWKPPMSSDEGLRKAVKKKGVG